MTYPQLNLADANGPKATIKTNHGDVTIQLFPDQAPKTVENFITLAKQGYYDGVTFHRVIPEFMIQGGDRTGTGAGGQSSFGAPFEDEFSRELFNFNGALSMANAGPNTNGSQFFIVSATQVPGNMIGQMKQLGWPAEVVANYEKNGGTPWLDGHHTVFGQVISGMDVVDEISRVARDAADKPKEDVVMTTVEITEE